VPPAGSAAVRDESQLWREIAAATFCSDGVADGWDSDTEEPASNEDKYLKVGRDRKSTLRCCGEESTICG